LLATSYSAIQNTRERFSHYHEFVEELKLQTSFNHVKVLEPLYKKGDIVVRDIKQQRSIFHHYKIANFTVTHSQKNSTDNGEVGNFIG